MNEASVCDNDLTVNVAYAGVRDAVTRQLIVEVSAWVFYQSCVKIYNAKSSQLCYVYICFL